MIDLHQDLFPHMDYPHLFEVTDQTSTEAVAHHGFDVIVATAWRPPIDGDLFHAGNSHVQEQALAGDRMRVESLPHWFLVLDEGDLAASPGTGVVLHVEGLNVLPREECELDRWWTLGWRSCGPVWAYSNWFGASAGDDGCLTGRGSRFVRWMDRRPMILDFAHMGDATFWDAARLWEKPIVVSHSGVRRIHDVPRNLSDDQLRAIGSSGGVVGISVAQSMAGPGADIAVVLEHIRHVIEVAGLQAAALGSDWGGVGTRLVTGLEEVGAVGKLAEGLRLLGLTSGEVNDILDENARRTLGALLSGGVSP
jgi:membrane dipeptidase